MKRGTERKRRTEGKRKLMIKNGKGELAMNITVRNEWIRVQGRKKRAEKRPGDN